MDIRNYEMPPRAAEDRIATPPLHSVPNLWPYAISYKLFSFSHLP